VSIIFQPGGYVPTFQWRSASDLPDATTAIPTKLDPNTVAVLPFVNLSADPEQMLFCDGTTEEVIHKLTSVTTLDVLGLTTAFALQQSAGGPLATCRRLGVATLIEGSVRSSGGRMRVAAKAVAVNTGRTLWSHSFDRNAEDIFSIQDEIAHRVAAALRAPERATAAPVRGPGVDAYTLYLKGTHIWDDGTPERCLAAIDYFNQAASRAPDFSLPYAGLANAYQWMALWGWMRPAEAQPKSRQAALESLRIDSHSAEGYASLAATLLRFDWDWRGAEAAAGKALELNPGCGLAHSMKANCALMQSNLDEALVSFERALHLDPLSTRTNCAMGIACWVMGKYGEAERWFRAAQELNCGALLPHYFLMRLYLSMARYAEAIEANLAFGEQPPSHLLLSVGGAAYAGNGNREEALRILRRLEHLSQSEYVDPLAMAIVQVGLQDLNGAFASLLKALDERPPMAAFLNVDPSFAPLRQDQRFGAVRSTLRLS
jgi:TolB-like protein/tetratricopeptide (TPR) repeat protein